MGQAAKDKEITHWFYLTGGTALAEFYLHHRLSDDIDLFSYSQVNDRYIDSFSKKITPSLKVKEVKKDHIMGLFVYKLKLPDDTILKIDFNEYEFTQVEKGSKKFADLAIDSFYDISINKLYSIVGRFQTRDFIDLYFILQRDEFSLEQLIERAEEKFKTKIDRYYLSSQFLRVFDLPKAYPKMLKPFSFKKMQHYFIKIAERLGKSAL